MSPMTTMNSGSTQSGALVSSSFLQDHVDQRRMHQHTGCSWPGGCLDEVGGGPGRGPAHEDECIIDLIGQGRGGDLQSVLVLPHRLLEQLPLLHGLEHLEGLGIIGQCREIGVGLDTIQTEGDLLLEFGLDGRRQPVFAGHVRILSEDSHEVPTQIGQDSALQLECSSCSSDLDDLTDGEMPGVFLVILVCSVQIAPTPVDIASWPVRTTAAHHRLAVRRHR